MTGGLVSRAGCRWCGVAHIVFVPMTLGAQAVERHPLTDPTDPSHVARLVEHDP